MSIYSQVFPLIKPDMDYVSIEVACHCYEKKLDKNTALTEIKKHIRNNQLQADILHILACMQNLNLQVMPRLSTTVKLLRDVINSL